SPFCSTSFPRGSERVLTEPGPPQPESRPDSEFSAPDLHHFRCKLTLAPQNRYTTLVWRFLPVAVETDVRPKIKGLERTPAARKFPPELYFQAYTGRAGLALEGLCTRLFA